VKLPQQLLDYANQFLSANLHNWLLVTLALNFGVMLWVVEIRQLHAGPQDQGLVTLASNAMIWWGGIVAAAHSSKAIAVTMNSPADPAAGAK